MPYIPTDRRDALFNDSQTDYNSNIETAGELNYMLTEVIIGYLLYKGLNYQTMNDIVGALDNCKDEYRRRIQHPYEDKKIKSNSDVYQEVLKLLKKVK